MADLSLVFSAIGVQSVIADLARMERSAMSMGNAFSTVANSLTGPAGIAAITSGVVSLGKSAVQSAIEYETLSTQFEVFLGSAEKATTVLADLNKFSIETPFTPDQVNKAGRSLLAFGVTTENLLPTLRMVGDVSSAVGKDFNELAQIFGKAKTANQLFAEDINQLTGAGIPIIDELAKVMGVATDQVKILGSKGKIHFAELEKAFANMSGEGGRFSGMMDKMSHTTAGLISTIEGKLQDEMRAIGMAMLPTVKVIVEGMEPAFNSLKDAIVTIYEPMADALAVVGDIVGLLGIGGKEGNKFANIVSGLANILKVLTIPAQLVWKIIGGIVSVVKDLVKGFQFAIKETGVLGQAFLALQGPIGWAILGFDSLFGSDATAKVVEQTNAIDLYASEISRVGENMGLTAAQMKVFIDGLDAQRLAMFGVQGATNIVAQRLVDYRESIKRDLAGANSDAGVSIKSLNELLGILKGEWESTTSAVKRSQLKGEMSKVEKQIEALTGGKSVSSAKEGSILFLEERLSKLQKAFKETDDEIKRIAIKSGIEGYQFMLAKFGNEVERINTIKLNLPEAPKEIDALNASLEKMHKNITDFSQLPNVGAGNTMADWVAGLATSMGDALPKVSEFATRIKLVFMDLKDSVKSYMVQMAADVAFNIGEAIGSGGSIGDVFKAALREMAIQIPKLVGMALLNEAATVPSPASLPMAVAGLGLIGASGILSGVFKAADAKKAAASVPDVGARTAAPVVNARGLDSFGGGSDVPMVIYFDNGENEKFHGYIRRGQNKLGRGKARD